MGNLFTTFTNCRLCINGQVVDGERLVVSQDDGLILKSTGYIGGEIVDLDDAVVAPGFLELHAHGFGSFHYSDFESPDQHLVNLESVARKYPSHGVTGFWATIPTIEKYKYQKVLPCLKPREFHSGASLMGAHVEGPYLNRKQAGAHNPDHFVTYSTASDPVYGPMESMNQIIKLATVAPDVDNAYSLIKDLSTRGIRVSLGHTCASYDMGVEALSSGASCLTQTLNYMEPIHHRDPGLAGLISLPQNHEPPPPYYTILGDGVHLHPQTAALLLRVNMQKAILASHTVKLVGQPDGLLSGNPCQQQQPQKTTTTVERTEPLADTSVLIDQYVRNLMKWSGCNVAEAVRTVTENIADFMGIADRGKLEEGRRADFVVLDDSGYVQETWIAGVKVWSK